MINTSGTLTSGRRVAVCVYNGTWRSTRTLDGAASNRTVTLQDGSHAKRRMGLNREQMEAMNRVSLLGPQRPTQLSLAPPPASASPSPTPSTPADSGPATHAMPCHAMPGQRASMRATLSLCLRTNERDPSNSMN